MALSGFSWIDEDQTVAGMGRPWRLGEALEALKRRGVGAVLSLTESPLDEDLVHAFDMEYLHAPILDFSAPSLEQAKECVAFIERCVRAGKKVVVHCGAGMGRTGTILACWLVARGQTPEEAIRAVRAARPGSIETSEQEWLIRDFAQSLATRGTTRRARNPRKRKQMKRRAD